MPEVVQDIVIDREEAVEDAVQACRLFVCWMVLCHRIKQLR